MKLYWRVKINGKWTWRPVDVIEQHRDDLSLHLTVRLEEEE